jgi:uncharacterized integral membrane protein
MPWKLFFGMFCALVVALFIGFNTKNTADLSIVFTQFKDIPVYLIILFSFIGGMAAMLPITIKKNSLAKKAERAKEKLVAAAAELRLNAPSPAEPAPTAAEQKKNRRAAKSKKQD